MQFTMQPRVSIIILNWNGLNDTIECLESLKKIDYPNYEVILVDNNSTGNDVGVIKKEFGNFINKIIVNKENLGFSGGNNIGIKDAINRNSEYILLLNNDTVVEKNFLNILLQRSIANPDVGLLGPLICYYSDHNKVWSAYGFISKIRGSGFSKKRNSYADYLIKDKICSFLSGCCLLIKKEVIEKVGALDENYFLYLEDTDYCYRALQAGFKMLYVGQSRIYHKVNVSTKKSNKLLPLYYTTRNRLYFAKKNLAFWFYIISVYLYFTMKIKRLFSEDSDKMKYFLQKAYLDFKNGKFGMLK